MKKANTMKRAGSRAAFEEAYKYAIRNRGKSDARPDSPGGYHPKDSGKVRRITKRSRTAKALTILI